MFEIQLKKLNEAKREQEKILEEIVDFLNDQMEELRRNGVDFYHEYDCCELSFGIENGSIAVDLRY